jgi:hypothetical protein
VFNELQDNLLLPPWNLESNSPQKGSWGNWYTYYEKENDHIKPLQTDCPVDDDAFNI